MSGDRASPAAGLERVPLGAAVVDEPHRDCVAIVLFRSVGGEAAMALAELTFDRGLPFADRLALARNIARRLYRDAELLPER